MSKIQHSEHGAKFVKGAAILSITGIIAKVFGAFFRIPLNNWIGAAGMSYYGVAYPIYSFFLIIATAGLPVAISKMVSERVAIGDYINAHRVYKVSLHIMFAIGVFGFIVCYFGADIIAAHSKNPGGAASLRAIAPALLTAPIVASFRGYSQGQQQMMPTGASEVIEQLMRVFAGLGLAYMFLSSSRDLTKAAACATFGASAGSIAALILLLVVYIVGGKERKLHFQKSIHKDEPTKSIFSQLLKIAVPITIGSAILPFMMIVDLWLVMRRLQATGWTHHQSKQLYGLISGFCDPLIGFPQVFTIAVAVSLVPAISSAFVREDMVGLHKNIQTGIKTSMIISFPCMIGLIALARPILFLLYPGQPEDSALAVPTLQVLSLGIVCLSILRTFSSVLQGIGKPAIPVVNLSIGVICKFIITYILVGIPAFNINGAAAGNVAAYGITAILNYRAMHKLTGTNINIVGTFVKPAVAALVMGAGAHGSYVLIYKLLGSNSLATLAAMIIAVFIYVAAVFVTKCLGPEEILMMPKGEKLLRLTNKFHLTNNSK